MPLSYDMALVMMLAAQPSYFKWLGVVVMVALYLWIAALLAREALHISASHGETDHASSNVTSPNFRIGRFQIVSILSHVGIGAVLVVTIFLSVHLSSFPPTANVALFVAWFTDVLDRSWLTSRPMAPSYAYTAAIKAWAYVLAVGVVLRSVLNAYAPSVFQMSAAKTFFAINAQAVPARSIFMKLSASAKSLAVITPMRIVGPDISSGWFSHNA